jgi:hypothetical protein
MWILAVTRETVGKLLKDGERLRIGKVQSRHHGALAAEAECSTEILRQLRAMTYNVPLTWSVSAAPPVARPPTNACLLPGRREHDLPS